MHTTEEIKMAIESLKAERDMRLIHATTSALTLGIEALEKQLPKKVINTTTAKDGNQTLSSIGKCPCCKQIISEDTETFICDCGQKLVW